MEYKNCENCNNIIFRTKHHKTFRWNKLRFCSKKCANFVPFNDYYVKNNIAHIKWRDKIILCDLIDLQKVNKYAWCVDNQNYAKNSKHELKMHHLIVGKAPVGMVIDHINRNKLDNRKSNLRITTQEINCRNKNTKNKFGQTGVYFERGKYRAEINVNKKKFNLGIFNNLEDAINCRKKAEIELWK